MKYPAIAVTALAAFYAAGWVGALLLVLTVVALWAAGEPSSSLDDDPIVRGWRALARTRHLASTTTTTTTKEQSDAQQAEVGRGPGVRRESGTEGRGGERYRRAVVAERRRSHLAGDRSRVPRAAVATGTEGVDVGQPPLLARHLHPTADHYRKADG